MSDKSELEPVLYVDSTSSESESDAEGPSWMLNPVPVIPSSPEYSEFCSDELGSNPKIIFQKNRKRKNEEESEVDDEGIEEFQPREPVESSPKRMRISPVLKKKEKKKQNEKKNKQKKKAPQESTISSGDMSSKSAAESKPSSSKGAAESKPGRLAMANKARKSKVWDFMKKETIDEDKIIKIICIPCEEQNFPNRYVKVYDEGKFLKTGGSTSNHIDHLKNHHGISIKDGFTENEKKERPLEKWLVNKQSELPYTDESFRKLLEELFIAESLPYTLIESKYFIEFISFCMGSGKVFKIVKADALNNSIQKRIVQMRTDIKEKLSLLKNTKIHLIIDMWTSPNMYSFICVVARFCDENYTLHEVILDLWEDSDHSGKALSEELIILLKDFDIGIDQIGGISLDNASSNDTMMLNLESVFPTFISEDHRIRCFAHILNLSAKKLLSAITGSESQDFYDFESCDTSHEGKFSHLLNRLRYLVKKIRSSAKIRKSFHHFQEMSGFTTKLELSRDVETRWNSTFYMIKRILELKEPLIAFMESKPRVGKTFLNEYFPTSSEWVYLEILVNLLNVFESSTKTISSDNVGVSLIIPLYIVVFSNLEKNIELLKDENLDIAESLSAAHSMLGKYYSKALSPYYVASVLIDPRFKMDFLRENNFDYTQEIRNAKKLIFEMMREIQIDMPSQKVSSSCAASSSSAIDSSIYAFLFKEKESASSQPVSCEEEFEQFSMDPNATCKGTEDPLSFWAMNRKRYPRLSLVAKNILSCPGASVAVERVFNIGRDVISLRRSALGPDTARNLIHGRHMLKKMK
jgi:hypothetical protein